MKINFNAKYTVKELDIQVNFGIAYMTIALL